MPGLFSQSPLITQSPGDNWRLGRNFSFRPRPLNTGWSLSALSPCARIVCIFLAPTRSSRNVNLSACVCSRICQSLYRLQWSLCSFFALNLEYLVLLFQAAQLLLFPRDNERSGDGWRGAGEECDTMLTLSHWDHWPRCSSALWDTFCTRRSPGWPQHHIITPCLLLWLYRERDRLSPRLRHLENSKLGSLCRGRGRVADTHWGL